MKNVRLRVPIVSLVLAALALYVFSRWQARQGSEDATIIRSAEQALAVGKAYRVHQAQLRTAAQRAGARATSALAAAGAKDTTVARLQLELKADTAARDSVRTLVVTVTTVVAQRDSARGAARAFFLKAVADSTRADRAEARVQTLEANLAATLTVADCRMLGLRFLPRCPGRLVSAALGAGLTAVAFVATRH